jgi:hypothetical protein
MFLRISRHTEMYSGLGAYQRDNAKWVTLKKVLEPLVAAAQFASKERLANPERGSSIDSQQFQRRFWAYDNLSGIIRVQKSYKRVSQVKNTSPCRNARNIFRHPAPSP